MYTVLLDSRPSKNRVQKRSGWVLFEWKGLSREIFTVISWLEWIYLGLHGNRFWFFNFKEGSSIWDSLLKYWWVSYQTLSDICRISEKHWQVSSRFSNFPFSGGRPYDGWQRLRPAEAVPKLLERRESPKPVCRADRGRSQRLWRWRFLTNQAKTLKSVTAWRTAV